MLRHIEQNPDFKTGADFVKAVSTWIKKRILMDIAFDTFKGYSLKEKTRENRYAKETYYHI